MDEVCGGDIVIATAAIRQEGTSREYLPIEFPAAADFSVVAALREAAVRLGLTHHIGVIQSKDSFYGEIRPQCQPIAADLKEKWTAWTAAGVLASEMEAAALYLNAARLGKNALTICTISDNPFTGEELDAEARQNTFTQMMEIALEIA